MYKLLIDFSTDVFLQNLQDCGKILRSQFLEYSIFEITVKISRFILIFIEYDSFLIDFSTFSQLTYFYKNSSIITSWVFYFCNFEISVKISRSILIFIERFVMYKFFLDRFLDFFSTDVFTKLARFYFGKILRSQFFEYSIFEIIVKISRPILN